jgi:prolyl-tRNA synthetase
MKLSKLFSQTLREVSGEVEVASHQLLLRAGFIRQLAAGIFSYLPLAKRSLSKIENIMREEMNAIDGQEITMPVVHPADLWKETGRWHQIGAEMGRFKDKSNRDMVLAMTHEEVVGDLTRKEIRSYRQLPSMIYHIQTKWRDDPRPRAGLIRAREFTMLDSYSLDADSDGLEVQYRNHYQVYFNIFNRCFLPVVAVKSDVGMMGGSMAHEFMYLAPIGEDTIMTCAECSYSANRQIARFAKRTAPAELPQPVETVATPNMTTIAQLCEFLKISPSKTAKAVFMTATFAQDGTEIQKLVFAVVRGDMDLNETKLANAVKAKDLRAALDHEIKSIGAVPGYASPIGVRDAIVVVDDTIPNSPNLVSGANQEGYHFLNVNYGRDFSADLVCDIAVSSAGDSCPNCGHPLSASRGVEVGNIFKLGTRYSESLGCTFLDKDGKAKPVIMGSYGIGVGRLLSCIAEEHHDDKGLAWPISVAPYHVHLIRLAGENCDVVANQLYENLAHEGVEVLFDDRAESAGVKFADADLIGLPIRITVGQRALAGNAVEMKRRTETDAVSVSVENLIQTIKSEISAMQVVEKSRKISEPFV